MLESEIVQTYQESMRYSCQNLDFSKFWLVKKSNLVDTARDYMAHPFKNQNHGSDSRPLGKPAVQDL